MKINSGENRQKSSAVDLITSQLIRYIFVVRTGNNLVFDLFL
jgi:hypothetical protein